MKRNNTLYNRELVENHYKYSVTIFSNFALKSPFKALKCSFYSNGSPKRDTQEHIKNLNKNQSYNTEEKRKVKKNI